MTNPAQYLLERKSDGIVMSCANLPMEFEAAATRAGTICALAPAQLAPLAAPIEPIWDDDLGRQP